MTSLPTPDVMYRALEARDPDFDGIFFVAVKTTRIFCRSVCHARTPKRDNVEFFATPHDALYAGYRPCLRCRPLDLGREPPAVVSRLLAAVEADPSGRLREADLARMGIDPSSARRAFQRYCGMSFHAYHRARRMGLALSGIRKGKSMIDLQLDHGFESGSGFREAFARVFGTAPSQAHHVDCVYARWFETPLGPMLALANDTGLHLLEFVDRRGLERELEALRARLPHPVVPGQHAYLDQVGEELAAYFEGRSLQFTTPLLLSGSPFQLEVWNALRAIPAGTTRSYRDIASPCAATPQCARSDAPTATTSSRSSFPAIASSAPTAVLRDTAEGCGGKRGCSSTSALTHPSAARFRLRSRRSASRRPPERA